MATKSEKPARKKSKVGSKGDSRSQVINAYIELAHRIGVPNITLEKIAAEAGVAFGTVRYYFNSESTAIHDEAFKRVLERSYANIEIIFSQLRARKDFNPLHSYAEAMLKWVHDDRAAGCFLIYYYYLSASETPHEVSLTEIIEKARVRVESLLLEAVGMGLYRRVPNTKDCAQIIHSTVVGHGFVALALKTKKAFEQQTDLCIRNIDSLIESNQLSKS